MFEHNNIGILTGGGDVPGLNSVIKAVVTRATDVGRRVVGIRRGWKGLTDMTGPDDAVYVQALTLENTRTIDRNGGTMLHTSRTNPRRVALKKAPEHISQERLKGLTSDGKNYDFTPIVLENLAKLDIKCLIAIGGDDTLSYATVLGEQGFPVIGIPKTMDNDVQGTEYCIGFSTAISRASDAVTRQRSTLGSHERIGVFRIFGRDAGFTALYTAYATSTRCLIPEHPFDLHHIAGLLMADKRNNSSNYSIVVVSEGAVWKAHEVAEKGEPDPYGHRRKANIGEALGEQLARMTGEEIMVSDLTYDLRSGPPDPVDQIVATTYANIAMDLIDDGVSGRMIGVQKGCYTHSPLPAGSLGARKVDIATLYDIDRYRPKYTSKLGAPMLINRV